jgi:hypothetical protein
MTNRKTITDSLAGARIILQKEHCQLQQYNFVENQWYTEDEAIWPLPRVRAEEWVVGWNREDRFTAMNILTAPLCDREA